MLQPVDDEADQFRIWISDVDPSRTIHRKGHVHSVAWRFTDGQSCFFQPLFEVDCFSTDGELSMIWEGDDLQVLIFIPGPMPVEDSSKF